MSFNEVNNKIRNRYFHQAVEILESMVKSPERDLFLAEAYVGDHKNEEASPLLMDLFFKKQAYLHENKAYRDKVVALLDIVLSDIDHNSHNLMNMDFNQLNVNNINILKAFYLGGAKHGLTLAEKAFIKKKEINRSLNRGETISTNEYFIQFLKVFSSYTPLLQSSVNQNTGGGYFLCLNKYGLVIDPGHHFLDNFYKAGRSFKDINGIAVTHFHDDHYADLPSLLALIHQSGSLDKQNKKYDLFLDRETFSKFRELFISSNMFRKKERLKYNRYGKNDPIKIKNEIILETLPANHPSNFKNGCVGLLINIDNKKVQVFITGDTGWNAYLGEVYKKKKRKNYDCILVAHISSFFANEIISYLNGAPEFYDKHLCIHGLKKAIECLDPKKIVLSEIGEELSQIIQDLQKLIYHTYGKECIVGQNDHIVYLK